MPLPSHWCDELAVLSSGGAGAGFLQSLAPPYPNRACLFLLLGPRFKGGRQKRPVGSHCGGQTPPNCAQHSHSYSLPKSHPLLVLSLGNVPPAPPAGVTVSWGARGGWGSPGTAQLWPLVASCLSFPMGKQTPSWGVGWDPRAEVGVCDGGASHPAGAPQAAEDPGVLGYPTPGLQPSPHPWGPPFHLDRGRGRSLSLVPPVTHSQVAITPLRPPAHVCSTCN